jgi:hypothetical protein
LPRERGALGAAAKHACSSGSLLGFCVKKKRDGGEMQGAARGLIARRRRHTTQTPRGERSTYQFFFAIPHLYA